MAIVALIPGIWSLPLIDHQEPHFSHATVEMIERGEWVTPYFNNEHHLATPPLTNWWMRANFALFGINETGARMHSIQASWLIALLLFRFARRLGLDQRMAFLTGFGWLTTLQVLIHSRLAVADMPLVLFLLLTMTTLHQVMHQEVKTKHTLSLSLWLAMGFLTKGPLAYAIPQTALLFTFILSWWQGRQESSKNQKATNTLASQKLSLWKAQKALFIALIPSLLMISLWAVPALSETKGAFLTEIGKPFNEQILKPTKQRFSFPWLYHLLIIIPFLLPWSAQLPATLKKSLQLPTLDSRFLLGWFVAPFLVFTFSPTQLPQQLLPAYPAFFLLFALNFRKKITLGRFGKFIRNSALAFPALLGIFLFILGLTQVTRGREALDLAFMITLSGGAFLSLAIIGAAAMRREKIARFAIISAFISFTIFLLLATAIARNAHLTLRLKETTGLSKGTLTAVGYQDPSLVWYFDNFQDRKQNGFWNILDLADLPPEIDSLTIVVKRRWQINRNSAWPLLSLKKEIPTTDDNTQALVAKFGQKRIEQAEVVSGWSSATSSWIEALILR